MGNSITQEAPLVGHVKPQANLTGNMKPQANLVGNVSVPKIYYEGTSEPATKDTLGLIKVGNNLTVTEDGTLSAEVPVMDANTVGGAKLGDGLKINNGALSVDVATEAEEDNTKPITSAAVNTAIGNINSLLSTI